MANLFSIIIPTYNRRHLVSTAIDSALSQEVDAAYEVIVGDDGSTDGTPEYLEHKYGDRIRVFRQENAGPGPARNLAASHATGDYLALLDSDDLLLPWTLAIYKQLIEEHDCPSLIVGQAFDCKELEDMPSIPKQSLKARHYDHLYGARLAVPLTSTDRLAIRRDVFESLGGFTGDVLNTEDIDFCMRAGLAAGLVAIDTPATFARRHHPEQISQKLKQLYQGRLYLIDQELQGAYPGGDTYRPHRRELMAMWGRISSLHMLEGGLTREGWHFYRRVFFWNLQVRHWRYLKGFPLIVFKRWLRRMLHLEK